MSAGSLAYFLLVLAGYAVFLVVLGYVCLRSAFDDRRKANRKRLP
jgi:hypothetical protein